MSLGIWEFVEKNTLEVWKPQKWISHTPKPIPRHKKIQNPSNGSKVTALFNFGIIKKFLKSNFLINFYTYYQKIVFYLKFLEERFEVLNCRYHKNKKCNNFHFQINDFKNLDQVRPGRSLDQVNLMI